MPILLIEVEIALTGSMNDESQLLIQDVVEAPSKVTVNNATGDETIHNLIDDYPDFKDEVRREAWQDQPSCVVCHTWITSGWFWKLILAVKINNFVLYCQCLYKMSSILQL